MKKVGIACDDWKEKAFCEALTDMQFKFEVHDGVTEDTRLIQVQTPLDRIDELTMLVRRVQQECDVAKRKRVQRERKRRRRGQ